MSRPLMQRVVEACSAPGIAEVVLTAPSSIRPDHFRDGGTGGAANVQIFRVADTTLERTLSGDPNGFATDVAFAPTGARLAFSSGITRTIQAWDTTTCTPLASHDQETGWGDGTLPPLAFSPYGTELGYGRSDATVVLARP